MERSRNSISTVKNGKGSPTSKAMTCLGEGRGGRLGDEVTSQMQVIQSIADKESNFIIETRKLFSLLWKTLEAHCFRSLVFQSFQCQNSAKQRKQ